MHKLPVDIDFNTIEILNILNSANYKLGELNGMLRLLPNPKILLNAITLGEAKDSSEIENIITTYDELYKEMSTNFSNSLAAKEVINYRNAINHGMAMLERNGYISIRMIAEIQECIEKNKGGIRKLPGTVVKNTNTGEVLHTPPQSESKILDYLSNLEVFINNENSYDPLINMAIIHYQFETIHPFYDGNGRTGRIINILYLVLKNRISLPILYLSRYIIKNKLTYYSLLHDIQMDETKIIDFVIYMLRGVEEISEFTIHFIEQINESLNLTTKLLKEKLPKIYSKELVELLYYEFYTKNSFLQDTLGISRNTATKYLKELEKEGFVISERIGKEVVYKNIALYDLIEKW